MNAKIVQQQIYRIYSLLIQGELLHAEEECLLFPKRSQVIQAAIVLIKEKNGKFQTFRVSTWNFLFIQNQQRSFQLAHNCFHIITNLISLF